MLIRLLSHFTRITAIITQLISLLLPLSPVIRSYQTYQSDPFEANVIVCLSLLSTFHRQFHVIQSKSSDLTHLPSPMLHNTS